MKRAKGRPPNQTRKGSIFLPSAWFFLDFCLLGERCWFLPMGFIFIYHHQKVSPFWGSGYFFSIQVFWVGGRPSWNFQVDFLRLLSLCDQHTELEHTPPEKKKKLYKVGPLPVITWVITPVTRVKKHQLPNYKAIYKGYNSIYNCFFGRDSEVIISWQRRALPIGLCHIGVCCNFLGFIYFIVGARVDLY